MFNKQTQAAKNQDCNEGQKTSENPDLKWPGLPEGVLELLRSRQ
jgi:hypothetical protein